MGAETLEVGDAVGDAGPEEAGEPCEIATIEAMCDQVGSRDEKQMTWTWPRPDPEDMIESSHALDLEVV